jgi:4-hydroxybenzoate polyprenyltransferase
VAGDPLAGFLLANFGVPTLGVLPALAASLCFYGAGLLHNDLVDLREDSHERPNRPLPSGAASPRAVWGTTIALCLVGLVFCILCAPLTLFLGAGLIIAVGTYNQVFKKIPFVGALNMGICRGLSLLLGASAAPARAIPDDAWISAVLLCLYIAAVTHLARFETRTSVPPIAAWLPGLVLICMMATVATLPPMGNGAPAVLGQALSMGLLTLAAILCFKLAAQLSSKEPPPLPPFIGRFIRLLLPIQAAFGAHSGLFGILFAFILLALWPISARVSKRFYAS